VAKANGVGSRGLKALSATSYATATIKADRSQHSFKLSLNQFMQKRGANAIISQGKKQKAANAKLFASIEKRFGVPAGPLIAIWGMETAFGRFTGNQNTISAVATLAYDCRRPDFFREQLISALKLVDKGVLSSSSRGAMHGEVGQTQFLPKNVFLYGADGDGGGINLNKKADALASTARFLNAHGFPRKGPYSAGSFAGWNAATVYQKALAIIANKIDGY
ncbi:MAG TPA: lytic murein transglycosylase, partial [Aestuariivirga sp.]|nr:lytic murein transglycosylase [Aestuariivirga sp.]